MGYSGGVNRAAWLVLSLLIQGSGCAVYHYPLQEQLRTARPLASEVEARFAYRTVGPVTTTVRWEDDEVTIREGVLNVEVPDWEGPQPTKFEYWQAKRHPSPAPLLVVTPILGGGKELARTNCRDFLRAGFHVLLVFRGTRVLRDTWSLQDPERFFRKAVAGRRALLDWAAARPEVDPDRMMAFGISMGGILTSLYVACEPRLHSAVIALAGGDVPAIIRSSTEGRLGEYWAAKRAETGLDDDALEAALRAAMPSDPLAMARAVDPRRVFMVTTRFDEVVPPRFQERLWEAFGRPARYDLPTGHYSGITYLPYITAIVARWLQARAGVLPVAEPGSESYAKSQ